MKKSLFCLMAAVAIMTISCSKESTKEIKPSDTSFSCGELGRYIELVDQPVQVTYSKRESALGGMLYDVTINPTFRLKKVCRQCKKADIQDIDFCSLICVATIQFQDVNGSSLGDASLNDGVSKKIKKLLMGNVGDTVSLPFSGWIDEEKFDSFVAFSPYLSADIQVGDDDDTSYDFSSDDDSNQSSGSEDWDAILDSYENYVNQYIKVAKKASNGDMDALSEMSTLMEEYQNLAEQLENASDEMSVSQMARYNRITTKIANAAM